MKTLLNTTTFIFLFCTTLSSLVHAQLPFTSPFLDSTQIVMTEIIGKTSIPKSDSNMFRIDSLRPSDEDASFMYFWWSGDNGFSFAPEPKHNHVVRSGDSSVLKMTVVPTENYGSGGPPPLTYNFRTNLLGNKIQTVLDPGTFLHVQTYRNAVKRDTMYLIVTYKNSKPYMVNGKLKIEIGRDASILDDVLAENPHYFPNDEEWLPRQDLLTFEGLQPNDERSVLIPVKIRNIADGNVLIRVYKYEANESEPGTFSVNTGTPGIDFFKVAPVVANSHDPNMMIADSDARYKCDYRGGNVHYTVKFQNDGEARTHYVRVECHLDDKLDLSSIDGIRVPKRFSACFPDSIRRGYEDKCGAIWSVDRDTRILTIEMHDLRLFSSTDPRLPRIDLARGQIEFDISVNNNYVFGIPVVSHAEIFFDSNSAIVTNDAETGCLKFKFQSFVYKYLWWFVGGFSLLLLIIILLLRRRRKKRRNASKK